MKLTHMLSEIVVIAYNGYTLASFIRIDREGSWLRLSTSWF